MPSRNFSDLISIMHKLRSDSGCPWDREQTHESLIPYLVEESYEVIDAINDNNSNALREELGDLLLQVVFHAQISSESGSFTIDDVIQTVNEKLVRRHPNVFGTVEIKSAEEQTKNWERIKKKEGKDSVLDGVPRSMPSLTFSKRIQQRAATVGFDWDNIENVWAKVEEESEELHEQVSANNRDGIEEEFGDLLFALVNYARFLKVDPENCLKNAADKFIGRFKKIEKTMAEKSIDMHSMSLEELDSEWNKIKKSET